MLAFFIAPASLLAEEAADESHWSGKATLGYLATSGNTENSTLNTGLELGYTSGNWSHLAEAFAINASENKITSAEAYELGWKSERQLTDHDFLFGFTKFFERTDKFVFRINCYLFSQMFYDIIGHFIRINE